MFGPPRAGSVVIDPHTALRETPMTTTAIPTTANEAAWRESAEHLHAGRIAEFLAYWTEDCRYEVAYPVGDFPAVVEGREALAQIFGGFASMAERIVVRDVRFHQTTDPSVAFVEETMEADLVGGGRYENRLAMRVTFHDGRIAEIFEYYGQTAHEDLLRSVGLVA